MKTKMQFERNGPSGKNNHVSITTLFRMPLNFSMDVYVFNIATKNWVLLWCCFPLFLNPHSSCHQTSAERQQEKSSILSECFLQKNPLPFLTAEKTSSWTLHFLTRSSELLSVQMKPLNSCTNTKYVILKSETKSNWYGQPFQKKEEWNVICI